MQWNSLPANIVSATSLAMFKARLSDFDLSKFAVLFQRVLLCCVFLH